MKQYSSWQALFYSFWSPDLYRDVARNWQGTGYLYLVLVVCLTVLFVCVQVQVVAVPKAQEIFDSIVNQAPSIKIEKGKLSIDKPPPYVLKEPKSGKPLITFDTRDTPMTLSESKSVILVTSKSIITQKHASLSNESTDEKGAAQVLSTKEESYDLSSVDNFTFDKVATEGTIHSFLKWLSLLMFLIWIPCGFLFCLIQTLIYALVGKIFTQAMSLDLNYPTLIRLAAVSLTPVLLLDSVLKVSGHNLPLWPICCVVLALGYLWFAIYANRQAKLPAEPTTSTSL